MTTTALLSPVPRQRVFSDLGATLPGALLYWYATGTTTPATTYSDSTLTTANANPMVANSGGLFGPIYLSWGVQYDAVLKSATGVTIWSQTHIGNSGVAQNTYDVTSYGAVGNGTTDDAAAIQAAIDAASVAGGTVYFPAATYRCIAALHCYASNVQFLGANRNTSIIRWTDAAMTGLTIDTTSNVSVSSSLTVDGAIGDRSLTVTDGSVFTAGNWAYLEDADTTHGTLLTKIVSIAGNVVTLEEALPCVLPVASTAVLYSYVTYPLLEGITIRDLGFACIGGSGTANKLTLLSLTRIHNITIDTCAFDGSVAPLLTPHKLKNGVIRNCTFIHAQTTAGSAIEVQTSTGLTIEACQATQCQFGFVTSRAPRTRIIGCGAASIISGSAIGRTVKIANGSNFSTVVGSAASDVNLTTVRIENASYCTVTGNTFLAYSAVENGAAAVGISGTTAKSHHNTVSGNTIYGGTANAAGISCVYDVAGGNTYNVITGNNISGCVRYGVYCGSSKNTITGNQIGSSDTGALLYVPALCGSNLIEGNVFTNEGTSTAASIHTSDGTGANYIGVNKLGSGSPTSNLHSTDLVVSHLVNTTNLGTSTQVHTGANTTETTAFTTTIAGGTLSTAYQGFRFSAALTYAANANNKTLKVYAGTAVVTITCADNAANINVDVRAMYESGAVYMDVTFQSNVTGAPVILGATSTDDWTANQVFKMTMTNGTATANDMNFTRGWFEYSNVVTRPALTS